MSEKMPSAKIESGCEEPSQEQSQKSVSVGQLVNKCWKVTDQSTTHAVHSMNAMTRSGKLS